MKNILKICVIAVLTLSMLLCIVACTKDDTTDNGTAAPTGTNAPAGPTEAPTGGEDPTEAPTDDEDPTEEPTESATVAIVTDGNGYAEWNPIG